MAPDPNTVHVCPINDVVEHDTDGGDCICGPRTEPVEREDGSNGWMVVHNSLDGRERDEAHLSAPTSAIVSAVHDGDSLTVSLDLGTKPLIGYALWAHEVPVRLAGCNARELTAPGGPEARDHLATLLPAGTAVTVTVLHADKFDPRRDAQITLPDGTDLVAKLAADGWVALWDGHGIKPVPPWPRTEGAPG